MFQRFDTALAGNPAQRQYGLAVGDIDGDGVDEILVCGFAAANQVLKFDGAALFDIADGALADPAGMAVGAAFGDIDGDGLEEVYVLNSDSHAGTKRQRDRLFARVGDRWSDLFALADNARVRNDVAGQSVAAIDRHGTGRYGFVVGSSGGPLRLYEPAGGHRLADLAPACGLAHSAAVRGLLVAPLTGSGQDIVATTDHGPNLVFSNRGDGSFDEIAGPAGLADSLEHGRGLALLDRGGKLDLCCGNWEGPHRLWRAVGAGPYEDLAPACLAEPSPVRTVICADFDNDGQQEILLNNLDEPNRLLGWREGAWRRLDPGEAGEGQAPATAAAVADIDGDGRLELLIAHGEEAAAPLTLYKAPAGGNWLRVRPLLPSGAPARGALVTLIAATGEQLRVIDNGSGYLCQMEPVAHFGLGEVARVLAVTVRWSDGTAKRVDAPPVNQQLTVPHPAA